MQVTTVNDVKAYNLSAGRSLPEWISERKRRTLLKNDVGMASSKGASMSEPLYKDIPEITDTSLNRTLSSSPSTMFVYFSTPEIRTPP